MKRLKIISAIASSIIIMGCEPGYENRYKIWNSTSASCTYTLYWRQEKLYKYSGTLNIDEVKIISRNGGIGYASNEFQFWAESLFVNDSTRIIPCDTGMFITNKEDNTDGEYTLFLTDSLIKFHKKLEEKYGDSIFNCFDGYWAENE